MNEMCIWIIQHSNVCRFEASIKADSDRRKLGN